MYSKYIVETPVTLFLGAGASKPLGKLLMGEFIDTLEHTFKTRGLFDEIVSRDRDLEFLFEELDEWISKDYYTPMEKYRKRSALVGILEDGGYNTATKEFEQKFYQLLHEART